MKSKNKRKSNKKKKSLNKYFKVMLEAKKKNLSSFLYNGQKYIGKKHNLLGMVYKKQ